MSNWNKTSTTSERLKEAMRVKHMRQADLAKATGLSKGGISNYVVGRYEPKADIISKLAKALNCSEMWLWGYDVPMERPMQPSFDGRADLTEGEKVWLELFKRLPDSSKPKLLLLVDLLGQVPEEKQEMLLEILQVTLKRR